MKLNITTTHHMSAISFGLRLQTEEIAKGSNGRENAKEGFTEVNKDRNVKNSIWGKIV